MFAIQIGSYGKALGDFRFYPGLLILGGESESLACSARCWKPGQYRRQWRSAARQLLQAPTARSAFVVSVEPGRNRLEWWPAFRAGSWVVFQNQHLTWARPMPRLAPGNAHKFVPVRKASRRYSGPRVSQWKVRLSSLERWLAGTRNAARPFQARRSASGG